MRLSTVFELLLIFLFIAFAASRSVDKHHHHHHKHGSLSKSRQAPAITKPATAAPNRYCQCTNVMCNCCRDFSLPVVSLKGPGCANVQYLTGDSMRLTMSFGDRILRNITLSGKKPRPVCMGLPGAETKFCGRIYGIQRTGDQFKACLALEMRSLDEIEAALRVSCFKFGPDGVKLEPGRPVPDTDDYDDDDDDYGLDDEDDDDDDDDFLADDEDEDEDNDVDSGDYTGFSALGDEFLDGFFGSGPSKKKKKNGTTPSPVKATKKPATSATTQKNEEKMNITTITTTTMAPNMQENSTPGKTGGNVSINEDMSDLPTTPTILTSTMVSVKVMQDGNTLEEGSNTNTSTETASENSQKTMIPPSTQGITTTVVTSSTQATNGIDSKKEVGDGEEDEEDEDEQEDDDAEEESEEEEGSTSGLIENTKEKEKQVAPQSKDDDERNILDGILGDDDEEEENEKVEGDDDEDDEEEEDEFRQLRSHVPRGPYQPMTLEDQERQFPGLSALIKPSTVPFMSLQEQERRFPGLAALIRPPSVVYQQPEMAFDFPPVRSARNHRRMRLPPA